MLCYSAKLASERLLVRWLQNDTINCTGLDLITSHPSKNNGMEGVNSTKSCWTHCTVTISNQDLSAAYGSPATKNLSHWEHLPPSSLTEYLTAEQHTSTPAPQQRMNPAPSHPAPLTFPFHPAPPAICPALGPPPGSFGACAGLNSHVCTMWSRCRSCQPPPALQRVGTLGINA